MFSSSIKNDVGIQYVSKNLKGVSENKLPEPQIIRPTWWSISWNVSFMYFEQLIKHCHGFLSSASIALSSSVVMKFLSAAVS